MNEIRQVIKASPQSLLEWRDQAGAGDSSALRLVVLAAVWREINATKGYSVRAKVEAFSAIAKQVDIKWQATT